MNNAPTLAALTPELVTLRNRWLELDRRGQDALYASSFAAPFARLFADLPLHGAPPSLPRPRALVSVLGFSWQPVALMAAWTRPEKMLVIGTTESLALRPEGEPVLSTIARISGVEREHIIPVEVGDPGETDIYRAVRDFLQGMQIPAREVFVDPTGGKKSMSASTALAAFLAGAPLVYVDYGEYHAEKRIPVAGTEYPRLLANPLDVLGDLALRDVFHAFDRGDFTEAQHLAQRLSDRLYEPREAETIASLARGYGAWDRFAFGEAHEALLRAREQIARFGDQGGWHWAEAAHQALERNLPALEQLSRIVDKPASIAEGRPLLSWYLAAAARLLESGKPSVALLLTYAAVERYLDLVLWVEYGLDDEKPDYARIEDKLRRQRFDAAGRSLFDKGYQPRPLAGPLMFLGAAQLLAALDGTRLHLADLGPLKGLSNARNKCEYEHGLLPKPPTVEEVRRHLVTASGIVARAFESLEALKTAVDTCRFPVLSGADRR